MARDLIKFFDDQKKSYARYMSSVDCLLEKYEDVIEDEMESVIDLSTNQIHKGKTSLLLSEREFDSVYDQSMTRFKEKDNSILMSMTKPERSFNTDFLEAEDRRGYVKKFLEEDEPEPSEGDTLSSVSSYSYSTVYSDYENDSVHNDLSTDDKDLRQSNNSQEDEIDGDIPEAIAEDERKTRTDNSENTSPDVHRKLTYDERNKDKGNRIDETYLVVKGTDLQENQNAKDYFYDKCHEKLKPTLTSNNNEQQMYNGACPSVINKAKLDNENVVRESDKKKNIKRVSTIFTAFSELKENERHGSDRNTVFKSRNHVENRKTKNNASPKDGWCSERHVNKRKEKQNEMKLPSNNKDAQEQIYDSNLGSPNNRPNKPDRNFFPKHTSEQIRSSYSDLSLSFRVKGSPQLKKGNVITPDRKSKTEENYMFNATSNVGKVNCQVEHLEGPYESSNPKENFVQKNSNIPKLNTPLHHKHARGMLLSKWHSSAAVSKDNQTCNETELDSFHDDNISSRKDSGFGTLNEESLTNDMPVHEELPEKLSLQNLDTFNKSLADQSAFFNVSMNCPGDKTKDSESFVEKWLKDVSEEMENVCETSLDKEVNRLSEEVCKIVEKKTENVFEFEKRSEKSQFKNTKQKCIGNEDFKGNVMFSPGQDKVSYKLSYKTHKSDKLNGTPTQSSNVEKQNDRKIDRHILKIHRNSTQDIFQRLKDEQVAEMMKNCDKVDNVDIIKRRHSDFTGKRFIDQSDNMVENEDIADVLPTPPKSRKLNENNYHQFRNCHGRTRSYGDKHVSKGQENNIVDRFIDWDDKQKKLHDNGKQEMLAYMLHRDSSKKPPNKKLEFEYVDESRNELPNRNEVHLNLHRSEINRTYNQHLKHHKVYYEKVNTTEQGTQTFDRKQSKKKSSVNRALHRCPDEQGCLYADWQKSPNTRWQRNPETQQRRNSETRRHNSPDADLQRSLELRTQEYPLTEWQRSPKARLQRNSWTLWQRSTDNVMQGIPYLRVNRNSETGSQRSLGTRIQEYSDAQMIQSPETRNYRNSETEFERSPEFRNQQSHKDIFKQRQFKTEQSRSPEKRQRKEREREWRVKNAYLSPASQYKVNQSYIRKLNCRNELENTADNFDDQDLDNVDGDIHVQRVYKGNENEYRNQLKPSPNGRNVHSKMNSRYENSNGGLFYENENDLNITKTVCDGSERFKTGRDSVVEVNHSARAIYEPCFQRREGRAEGEQFHDRKGAYNHERDIHIDAETYSQQKNVCEESSPPFRNVGRKYDISSDTDHTVNSRHGSKYKDDRHSETSEVFNNDNFFERGMFSNESGGTDRLMPDITWHGEKESIRENAMFARSQGQAYHVNHSPRAREQTLKHVTNARNENRSPHQQRHNYAVKDDANTYTRGYNENNVVIKSPSTRQSSQGKDNEFRSPSIQRRARYNDEDVFSPSTSLAKMRLNTPESKSNHRGKQHRSGQRQDKDSYRKLSLERTLEYDLHASDGGSTRENNKNNMEDERYSPYSDKENEDFSEPSGGKGPKVRSAQRFVSLDQIQGMPLQLRIQQLEAKHCNSEIRDGRNMLLNRESSNQYLCDQSNDTFGKFENVSHDNTTAERIDSSNVYHKYYEVINESKQNNHISLSEDNYHVNRQEHTVDRNGQRLETVSGEQKTKKSLFAPTCDKRNEMELRSGITFDAFKIPMVPINVSRNKLNPHNKENEHIDNKVYPEKGKCASIASKHIREDFASNPLANRRVDKMNLKYLQSTPIKPGCEFRLNTTMSTIVGSEDTEASPDQNVML